MQKVIYMEEAEQYAEYIAPKAGGYIREGRVDTFESYKNYTLFIFLMYHTGQSEIGRASCRERV